MSSFLNVPVFFFSFLFGLIYMFYIAPTKKAITVYPTDDNKNLFQFKDKVSNCFQLQPSFIKCSKDVEEIPIQI